MQNIEQWSENGGLKVRGLIDNDSYHWHAL